MKKIILHTVVFLLFVQAGNIDKVEKSEIKINKNYNITNYPYDLELIINYIKNNKLEKKYNQNLLYIYAINNNKKVNDKIEIILKKDITLDKTTNAYSLIDDTELNKEKNDIFYKTIKEVIDGNLEEINKYSDKKIDKYNKIAGILFSIKAFYYKDTDEKRYVILKEKAKKKLKNNLLFFYTIYKYDFIYENYISALEYLTYIETNKPYNGIYEDLTALCLIGSEKYINNQEYKKAWLLAKNGIRAAKKLNQDNNSEKILKMKKDLALASKKIIETENKNKSLILYIINETENSLKVK